MADKTQGQSAARQSGHQNQAPQDGQTCDCFFAGEAYKQVLVSCYRRQPTFDPQLGEVTG